MSEEPEEFPVDAAKAWLQDIGSATLHGSPPWPTFAKGLEHLARMIEMVDADAVQIVVQELEIKELKKALSACRTRGDLILRSVQEVLDYYKKGTR
jgi:hypothetical protein